MTLHFSQIGFTDALTFMPSSLEREAAPEPAAGRDCLLVAGSSAYLNLYVILPRLRSYGDNSTLTRSPGRIRM